MANTQPRTSPRSHRPESGARQPVGGKTSRFARAARDPQWSSEQSAQARARLARQAAQARQELLARRAAPAPKTTPAAAKRPARPIHALRRKLAAWLLTPLTVLVVLALLGSAPPVSSQTRDQRPSPSKESIEQMHHLIDVAKEAGLTDAQIRQITIEDEYGNVINAWDYLQSVEKERQAELARKQEEQNRVYLTPQDVFKELRQRDRSDLDTLRERLPFDRERYR